MNDNKFCCAGDFPVLIPYQDLVNLLELAKNLEQFSARLSRVDDQLTALKGMYGELLEKVAELDKLI